MPLSQITNGDYIAAAMFILAVGAATVREVRASTTKAAERAALDTRMNGMISAITTRLDTLATTITGLLDKSQKHEIDCARIQERTAASQERAAEILTEHGRAIAQLQGQIRHVATGSADKIIEFK